MKLLAVCTLEEVFGLGWIMRWCDFFSCVGEFSFRRILDYKLIPSTHSNKLHRCSLACTCRH